MHDYQRLRVWRQARALAARIYEVTDRFPRSESFGLNSQMRRAAVAVASNIAEGAGRVSRRELNRFVRLAGGSACELETQILIALEIPRLSVLIPTDLPDEVAAVKRMLHQLEHSLRP